MYDVRSTVPNIGALPRVAAFRKDGVRSLHVTHSIWAHGKGAEEFIKGEEHAQTPCPVGFAWSRLADVNAKILLLGVTPMSITFRHYAEYLYIEECLKNLEGNPEYAQMKSELHSYDKFGKLDPWPHVYNVWVYEQMEKLGMTRSAQCGNATFLCVEAKPFVDFVLEQLKKKEDRILWRIENAWDTDEWIAWRNRYEENIH